MAVVGDFIVDGALYWDHIQIHILDFLNSTL